MNSIDKTKNIAMQASAGTGKTYQLSMRVAAMLLEGVSPKDILCITFTNKATDEMLDKILNILDSLAEKRAEQNIIDTLEPLLKALAKRTKSEYNEQFIQDLAKKARNKLLAEFTSLNVKTLDAFCNLILKIFPFEANLRPDYETIQSEEFKELQKRAFLEAFDKLFQKSKWKELYIKLSEIFESNLASINENLLDYALFTANNIMLLKNTISKTDLTYQSFEKLINQAVDEKKNALNYIREFTKSVFLKGGLVPRQENVITKLTVASRIKELAGSKLLKSSPSDHSFFSKYEFSNEELSLAEKCAAHMKQFFMIKGTLAVNLSYLLGFGLSTHLEIIKEAENVVTFQDMAERAYIMLSSDKAYIEKDYLYFRLDSRINHILIDEFQDTSFIQWEVLRPLALEAMSGVGQNDKSGSFFYVGDLKQNIYRFRGGSAVLFDLIAQQYSDRISVETLPTNYRSDKNIVEFVNTVFQNAASKFKTSQTKIYNINQKSYNDKSTGYFEICYKQDIKGDKETYVDFTIKKIKEAHDKYNWPYSDMAVLVYQNDKGSELKAALSSQNPAIPVRLETSKVISATPIYQAIMALAEFVETKDVFAFAKYALINKFAVTPDKFADTKLRNTIMNYILNIASENIGKTILEKLLIIIKETSMYNRFKDEPDFIQTLDIISKNAKDEKNIEKFKEIINKASINAQAQTSENFDSVTIMTVHKSKGLQFGLVIIPDIDISLKLDVRKSQFILTNEVDIGSASIQFIHNKDFYDFLDEDEKYHVDKENEMILQDALNQLYVGMTRAKHALIIGVDFKKEVKEEVNNINDLLTQLITIPDSGGELTHPIKEQKVQQINYFKTKNIEFVPQTKSEYAESINENFQASIYGTALHAAAFLLNGSSKNDIEAAYKGSLAIYGVFLDNEERRNILRDITHLAESEHYKNILKGKVFRERKLYDGSSQISIDIYSIFDDKIILADYKTGNINMDQERKYHDQVNKYASVLSKLYQRNVEKYIYHFTSECLYVNKIS